jgi:hypothetical protein
LRRKGDSSESSGNEIVADAHHVNADEISHDMFIADAKAAIA